MFEKLAGMLTELEAAQGTKTKEGLLRKFVDDKDFLWLADMALSQGFSYGIEEFPEFQQALPGRNSASASVQLAVLIRKLEELRAGTGVTAKAVEDLHLFACTSPAAYLVTDRIIHKDLRCGVQAKTINRVRPGTVFRASYQRCSQYDRIDKMTWPALFQRKANGAFAYGLPDGSFMTRQGNIFEIPGNLISPFVALLPNLADKVRIHELVVLDETGTKVMSRAEGNGIINSFIKGTGDPEMASRVRAFIWGWVTPDELRKGEAPGRSYLQTWQALGDWLPLNGPDLQPAPIRMIESWFVKDLAEARAKFFELIQADEEGGIVKSLSPDFIWQDQSSCDYQIKMKSEADGEFRIVGAYAGDPRKKYAGLLGGITIESEDGLIVSDCGGGFTDEQRKLGVEYWAEQKGLIVTIKFNGLTTDRDRPGVYALDHPRFVELRYDKEYADTAQYCAAALRGESNPYLTLQSEPMSGKWEAGI